MKYDKHENGIENESVLGYLTTFGFHLRKGIKNKEMTLIEHELRTIPPLESLRPETKLRL